MEFSVNMYGLCVCIQCSLHPHISAFFFVRFIFFDFFFYFIFIYQEHSMRMTINSSRFILSSFQRRLNLVWFSLLLYYSNEFRSNYASFRTMPCDHLNWTILLLLLQLVWFISQMHFVCFYCCWFFFLFSFFVVQATKHTISMWMERRHFVQIKSPHLWHIYSFIGVRWPDEKKHIFIIEVNHSVYFIFLLNILNAIRNSTLLSDDKKQHENKWKNKMTRHDTTLTHTHTANSSWSNKWNAHYERR